ncbi:ORF_053L [Scale drop disease virus]|uniref:ORF_053L n=1 Tax=Scale drop disease virus TaxID=1697349 RepID=A0A0K1L6T7_9VIRU|nr:ORF_053L [Scale drop disease virus]AKU37468.1 ORF_053L [Scale drop disease virus]
MYSIYWFIKSSFIPIKFTGNAVVINSCSIFTASTTISVIVLHEGLSSPRYPSNKQAKSQCKPSSRLINSFENVNPGIKPRFFNQNMAANDPEKKMPSTTANATSRSPKESFEFIHLRAQSALCLIAGTVSIALNNRCFSCPSLMYVSIRRLYISE